MHWEVEPQSVGVLQMELVALELEEGALLNEGHSNPPSADLRSSCDGSVMRGAESGGTAAGVALMLEGCGRQCVLRG